MQRYMPGLLVMLLCSGSFAQELLINNDFTFPALSDAAPGVCGDRDEGPIDSWSESGNTQRNHGICGPDEGFCPPTDGTYLSIIQNGVAYQVIPNAQLSPDTEYRVTGFWQLWNVIDNGTTTSTIEVRRGNDPAGDTVLASFQESLTRPPDDTCNNDAWPSFNFGFTTPSDLGTDPVVVVIRTQSPSCCYYGLRVDWISLTEASLALPLDIKPGSCPNPVNLKSRGKLPVAVLGTEEFDVSMIDAASVALARADGVGGSVAPFDGPPGPSVMIEDVGTPMVSEACECHGIQGDGLDDLSVKFDKQEAVATLELREFDPGATVELIVSGTFLDGIAFFASDCILIVPQPDFDEDNDVDQSDFGHLQACYRGPMKGLTFGCEDADIDGDGDVDISDFGRLQRCISGANKAVDSKCAD